MTNETEAPETVFSDHDPEAVILALEGQVDAQAARIAEYEVRLRELEAERDLYCNHLSQAEAQVERLLDLTTRINARAEAAEAKLAKAVDGLRECEQVIDGYIWQEYPFDHPVHERYRQRDFSANPARATLAELQKPIATHDDPA